MIGSSAGMSQASISPWARTPAAAILSAMVLSSDLSLPLSAAFFLLPCPLILGASSRFRRLVAASVGEEAVGDDLVDQLGRQKIGRDVVPMSQKLVHVDTTLPLLPAH